MTRPLVTIVTPSFNQGRFLRRAIDSVLTQDYPSIEFIVMDGNSTDESRDILRSYGDRLTWVSQRDYGQTHALNKGFARSHGEIRGFLCADDVLLPGAISKVVRYFEAHREWDLLYGHGHFVDEADKVIGIYPTEPFSFRRLREECFICQPATFWRRSLAKRVGPFNESLRCSMDYEYWFRAHRAGGRIVNVDDFLAQSRIHPEMGTFTKRLDVYRLNIKICREQAGFAELNHFVRLWRYQCWESPLGWPGKLRWLPFFCTSMALLHYLRTNSDPRLLPEVVAGLGRGLSRLLAKRRTAVS